MITIDSAFAVNIHGMAGAASDPTTTFRAAIISECAFARCCGPSSAPSQPEAPCMSARMLYRSLRRVPQGEFQAGGGGGGGGGKTEGENPCDDSLQTKKRLMGASNAHVMRKERM